jgi:hypothetical protein
MINLASQAKWLHIRPMSKTFKHLLAAVEASNVHQITERAMTANGIAKLSHGHSRKLAYAVKERAVLKLVSLGWAKQVLNAKGPAVLYRLAENGRGLHLVARQVANWRQHDDAA